MAPSLVTSLFGTILGGSSSRASMGLDIDGSFLAAAQVWDGRLVHAASMELEPGLVKDGEIVEPERLGAELRGFVHDHGLPKDVWLGVSNQQIVVRQLDLPRIQDEAALAGAVRFQSAEAIPMPLDETVLDFQVVGEDLNAEGAPRTRVVVVAARRAMIDRLVDTVRRAGLRPQGIELDAFALIRALAGPPREEEAGARVYCHLAGLTNLAVAVGQACLFTRALPLDWESVENAATRVVEEIRFSIEFYAGQPQARPVEEIVLSGPGAVHDGLAAELGAAFGLPASVAGPLGDLDASGVAAGEDGHRLTVAAGLALGAGA